MYTLACTQRTYSAKSNATCATDRLTVVPLCKRVKVKIKTVFSSKRNEELCVEKGNARKGNDRNSSDDDNDTIGNHETQSDVLTFGASAIVPAPHTQ